MTFKKLLILLMVWTSTLFSAYAILPQDVEGEYFWIYQDMISSETLSESINILADGCDLEIVIANYSVPASLDAESGQISIPAGSFLTYDPWRRMDVYFYHGLWSEDNHISLSSPAIFKFSEGEFVLPENETISIGNEKRGYIYRALKNVFRSTKAGVQGVEISEDDSTEVYFRPDGTRVCGQPHHGIYIVRKGSSVRKIVL